MPIAAMLAAIVGILCITPVLAGPITPGASGKARLRWQTNRTVANRAVVAAKGTSAATGTSAAEADRPQRAVWHARGSRPVARPQAAAHRSDRGVVQASADKSDPFQDPFEDDPIPDSFGNDSTTRTSQPTSPDSDVPSAADEPLTLPEDIRRYSEDAPPDPLDETLPENQSVVEGLAPPLDSSCADYKKDCDEAIQKLRDRDITKIVFGIVIEGEDGKPPVEGADYPCECVLGENARFLGRNWSPTTFTWTATGTCFKPLYFQDVQLERYGHSWNPVVQPFMSAAHFFVSVPLLPYKMGLRTPNECVYTLGYYRPGSCAPYMIEPIPFTLRAAAYQAIGTTAFAFWFWPPPSGP